MTVLPEGAPKKVRPARVALLWLDLQQTDGLPPLLYSQEKLSTRQRITRHLLSSKELKDGGDNWGASEPPHPALKSPRADPLCPAPAEYPAKLNGKTGTIVLDVPDADEGSTFDSMLHFLPSGADEPTESFHVNDIVELKKGGVGLPRSVLGWAAGLDLAGNGLEIRVKDSGGTQEGKEIRPGVWIRNVVFEDEGDQELQGRVVQFERVGRRDGLFVRLLSVSEALFELL